MQVVNWNDENNLLGAEMYLAGGQREQNAMEASIKDAAKRLGSQGHKGGWRLSSSHRAEHPSPKPALLWAASFG